MIYRILKQKGLLLETNGHVELAGKPGVTLALPEQAGAALLDALFTLSRGQRLTSINAVLPKSRGGMAIESYGRGGGGAVWVPTRREQLLYERHALLYERRALQQDLRRLVWEKQDQIDAYGSELRSDATKLVEYWIKGHRDRFDAIERELAARDVQVRGDDEIHLDPSDERILGFLHKNAGRQFATRALAAKLTLSDKAIGKNLARLRKLGLIANERSHGYSITDAGREVARRGQTR
ncbi:MAG: hypothetical protein JXB04_12825 [Kiritimatiellae bacterium]|nr:hypothetical protein [Kiritimatiellia bacterium]